MAAARAAMLKRGLRLALAAALLGIAGLMAAWLTYPQNLIVWGLLLAAWLLAWWLPASGGAAPETPAAAEAATAELAMRARLASTQAELSTLRAVQQELTAAKQTAEAATLAKSEFLAAMSHEIRTPLNGILPLLDIVLGSELSATQREYLATANVSARELLRIVDDILDYSKAEAGKLGLESVSINVRDLVDSVSRLLQKPAEAKGLALRAAVDADVRPVVRGDPMRVRQILINLIGNAIKFTQQGGVSIRISRHGEASARHELLFAVRDTGIGLAPEAAQRLFQPFTQADASVTRRYGGTGLGLTICKKLVDLMGGRIGVRSEQGRGSVFWFTIPFEMAPGDADARPDRFAGARVMLVASPQRAQAIVPVLATMELEAIALPDTDAALTQLRQHAPLGRSFAFDLLVIDHDSARGDVRALLRALLNDRALTALRILALGLGDAPDPRVTTAPARNDDTALRQGVQAAFGVVAEPARAKPLLSAAALPDTALPAAAATSQALSGRVLLVEDHPVNQKVAAKLLERLGLTVDLAENGEVALTKLRQQGYGAVLMDCQMPVLDGYSATRRLRQLESEQAAPRTPVIAMTAHAMAGDRERCLQAGMDDYLSKPLDRKLLADTMAQWLRPVAAILPPPGAAAAAAQPAARPSAMSHDTPPTDTLDAAILADLEDIMGDELVTLVDAYLRDGSQRMLDLRAAAALGDTVEVGKLAHSLKSSSANVGAMPLFECARAVEEAARTGSLGEPVAQVAALEKLYANAAGALRARYRRP